MAAAGALATNASAHVPLTRPSHTSLFTGLLPGRTRPARQRHRRASSPRCRRSPTPWRRPASAPPRSCRRWCYRDSRAWRAGFATYSDRFEIGEDDARFLNTIQKRGDGPTAEAIDWLQQNAAQGRFFLWLHLYDPHDPYEPPEPYASRYPGRPYDGEVAWSDELVGRLDAALKRLGVADSTAARRHVRPWRGPGRARRKRPRLLRLPVDPARAARDSCPGRRARPSLRRARAHGRHLSDGSRAARHGAAARAEAFRPQPGAGAARRRARGQRADLCRVAGAAAALRLERPAHAARRPLQVHPGAARRALRPEGRSRRTAKPRGEPAAKSRGAARCAGAMAHGGEGAGKGQRCRGRHPARDARKARRSRLHRRRHGAGAAPPPAPIPRTRSRTTSSSTA